MAKSYIRDNIKQSTIYIEKDKLKAIKIIAANENYSFTEYVRNLINEDLKKRGIADE